MLLSEIGPKPYFDCSSDLGFRDIDQNHNWINDPKKRYANLKDIDMFLSRNSRIDKKNIVLIDY